MVAAAKLDGIVRDEQVLAARDLQALRSGARRDNGPPGGERIEDLQARAAPSMQGCDDHGRLSEEGSHVRDRSL